MTKIVQLRDRIHNLVNLIQILGLAHENALEKGNVICVLYDFVIPELEKIEQDLKDA